MNRNTKKQGRLPNQTLLLVESHNAWAIFSAQRLGRGELLTKAIPLKDLENFLIEQEIIHAMANGSLGTKRSGKDGATGRSGRVASRRLIQV